jgi:hypothetical protein
MPSESGPVGLDYQGISTQWVGTLISACMNNSGQQVEDLRSSAIDAPAERRVKK